MYMVDVFLLRGMPVCTVCVKSLLKALAVHNTCMPGCVGGMVWYSGVRAVQVTCTLHDICMSVFKCTVISWTQGNKAQDLKRVHTSDKSTIAQ